MVNDKQTTPPGTPPSMTPGMRYARHMALFLATFITTTAAGAIMKHDGGLDVPPWQLIFPVNAIRPISDGLTYSVPLMIILLCHELGHYFVARAHGLRAELPYFIPLPPALGMGTLGAVIGLDEPPADRRKLIDVAAAGPLAGLAVAVPIIIYGLSLSHVSTITGPAEMEGNSVLYAILKRAVLGAWLPSGQRDVFLHPIAFGGWTGLLLTMINLLPIGMLDGGHIAAAYFGDRYRSVSRKLHQALPWIGTAVFGWALLIVRSELRGAGKGVPWSNDLAIRIAVGAAVPWLVWWGLLAVVRRLSGWNDHPPVDPEPLPASRRALFWLMVIVLVLVLTPIPQRLTLVGGLGAAAGAGAGGL